MHLLADSALELARGIAEDLKDVQEVEIAIFPPSPYLILMKEVLNGTPVKYGAQNMYFEEKGAFTGEISPGMLKDIGCSLVLIGHSERRKIFNEPDSLLNRKLKTALEFQLLPYFCIGETLEERESGKLFKVIETQLKEGLAGISEKQLESVVVAYEPVWAIGTGVVATPEQAQEMHAFIRDWFRKNYSEKTAENIRILYGGSIKPDNIQGLISLKDIDGGLVGGASLKLESFTQLVRYSR